MALVHRAMLGSIACACSAGLVGCSLALGEPATFGWPSSDPDAYAYTTGPTCRVYDKTSQVDVLATLATSVVAISGLVLRAGDHAVGTPLAIAGGALAVPFVTSSVASFVGRSRCYRWARELPLVPSP